MDLFTNTAMAWTLFVLSFTLLQRIPASRLRTIFATALILVFDYFLFFPPTATSSPLEKFKLLLGFISLCGMILLLIHFLCKMNLRRFAIWLPVGVWLLAHWAPKLAMADIAMALGSWSVPVLAQGGFLSLPQRIGFSYVMFRLCLYAMEAPTEFCSHQFLAGLNYALFPSLIPVGPLSPYKIFQKWNSSQTLLNLERIWQGLLRIAVGLTKFYLFSGLFFQFTLSFHPKLAADFSWREFWLGFLSYPLFMYFNFSGFCDVVIGMGWVFGLENKENFNWPFAARNLREYWKRWHISLTELLQAMIFNPLSKLAYRTRKPFLIRHSAPALTYLVFLMIGLWHGFEWKYFCFGVWHATGLTLYHYWKLFTHSRQTNPSESRFATNVKSSLSWLLTMTFVWIGFFIFENSPERILEIYQILSKIN